jgi:hypothetical protein
MTNQEVGQFIIELKQLEPEKAFDKVVELFKTQDDSTLNYFIGLLEKPENRKLLKDLAAVKKRNKLISGGIGRR